MKYNVSNEERKCDMPSNAATAADGIGCKFSGSIVSSYFVFISSFGSYSNSWKFDRANFLKWFWWCGYSFGNGAPEIHKHSTYELLCITVYKSFSIRFLFFMRHLVDKFSLATAATTSHIKCTFPFFTNTISPIRTKTPFHTRKKTDWKRIQSIWQQKKLCILLEWNESVKSISI